MTLIECRMVEWGIATAGSFDSKKKGKATESGPPFIYFRPECRQALPSSSTDSRLLNRTHNWTVSDDEVSRRCGSMLFTVSPCRSCLRFDACL